MIARRAELASFCCSILIGASRKKFLGSRGRCDEGSLLGTIAANLAAAANGAAIFGVHDVAEHVIALNVQDTIRNWRDSHP